MARFSVYLPGPIHERAKRAGLNLSGLLRRAILEELRDRDDAQPEPGGTAA